MLFHLTGNESGNEDGDQDGDDGGYDSYEGLGKSANEKGSSVGDQGSDQDGAKSANEYLSVMDVMVRNGSDHQQNDYGGHSSK